MDESQTLDALANILNDLAEKPFDLSVHAQHIRLAGSVQGLETELQSALEMLTQFLAADDSVWLALIKAKAGSLDLETSNGVGELLSLYERAENDYLSIPLLQNHVHFLLEHHAKYQEEEKPLPLGELFSTEWTRDALITVVQKGSTHLAQGHLLWDAQRDWELEILEKAPQSERAALVDRLHTMFLHRLRQPHSNHEDTFQSYSSFTTNFKPPQEYESLLVAASKLRTHAVKAFSFREPFEDKLAQDKSSWDVYTQYITSERRAKKPDLAILTSVFERAIAAAAKQFYNGDATAGQALRGFWVGYCDTLRNLSLGEQIQYRTLQRATRSAPGSGEIWARYMRFLEDTEDSEDTPEDRDTVSDAYNKAFDTKLLQQDVEQLVPVVLARAGYEKRQFEAENSDDNLTALIAALEGGIDVVRKASKTGDAKMRLEKFLSEVYSHVVEVPENAIQVWQSAAKFYKTSYLAWIQYTDVLIKNKQFDQARAVFKDIHMKNIDWPEAVWEAWLSFEHLHGTVEQIETSIDKIERAQFNVNTRRAKEAESAMYEAMQMAVDQQSVQTSLPSDHTQPVKDVAMEIDAPRERGTKRAAQEEPDAESHKKARSETKAPPLKRDREHCTVFVSDLPEGVSEEDLHELFKDCGKIREIKITHLAQSPVATVEFFERDSVPQALTKDRKRVRGGEASVHLAWQSTLYVTNFPESLDDEGCKKLFGNYGTIFDVRWPSKKFKNKRRFCYVQFTSPSAAQSALVLHGHQLEPGMALNVYISNPERKKERTDQDADDRELYVAGLSKSTTREDLEKLFKTYGPVKDVRMITTDDGKAKGFAFIEFEEENDARAALDANNYELKNRRIAVTMADSRVKAKAKNTSEGGLTEMEQQRMRSVRLRNLPAATQEGLLQQMLEKILPVKRVEVFSEQREALVELESAKDVGKLLLQSEPIVFGGNELKISEAASAPTGGKKASGGVFVPRAAGPKPRAGIGMGRKPPVAKGVGPPRPTASGSGSAPAQGRGQDDFRKMLSGS